MDILLIYLLMLWARVVCSASSVRGASQAVAHPPSFPPWDWWPCVQAHTVSSSGQPVSGGGVWLGGATPAHLFAIVSNY